MVKSSFGVNPKNEILLIVPYFGKWPIWFPAFLQSCGTNLKIDFLLLTDCELVDTPPNVKLVKTTMDELKNRAEEVSGYRVNLNQPYKCNDIRPLFGEMFAPAHKFWGHCDVDVIWGDICKFLPPLSQYDIISPRKHNLSGHFNLYRNTPELNRLYKQHWRLKEILAAEKPQWFDEAGMSKLVWSKPELRVFWDRHLLNYAEPDGQFYVDGSPSYIKWQHVWLWKDGQLFDPEGKEVMYLHFMPWKKFMKGCQIHPESFRISHRGINSDKYTI